jgi:hypothetical protein
LVSLTLAALFSFFFFRIDLGVASSATLAALASTFLVFFAGESLAAAGAANPGLGSSNPVLEDNPDLTYPCACFPSYQGPF